MKLFVTPTSPYARASIIAVYEKQLEQRVELIWTRTRVPDDPMLSFNPSGRIPFVLFPNGQGLEGTEVLFDYFDGLTGTRQFRSPSGKNDWSFRRIEALARSLLDGVSVWAREVLRPDGEKSPRVIGYESRKAARIADYLEAEKIMLEPLILRNSEQALNIAQILLFCALDTERRNPEFEWRSAHPNIENWFAGMAKVKSVVQSLSVKPEK